MLARSLKTLVDRPNRRLETRDREGHPSSLKEGQHRLESRDSANATRRALPRDSSRERVSLSLSLSRPPAPAQVLAKRLAKRNGSIVLYVGGAKMKFHSLSAAARERGTRSSLLRETSRREVSFLAQCDGFVFSFFLSPQA